MDASRLSTSGSHVQGQVTQHDIHGPADAIDTLGSSSGIKPYGSIRKPRAGSASLSGQMKTPTRSFYHRSFHGSVDPTQYSSVGVREQTEELASLALSDKASPTRRLSSSSREQGQVSIDTYLEGRSDAESSQSRPAAILEVSEPTSPDLEPVSPISGGPATSALSEMIRKSPSMSSGEDEDKNTPEEHDETLFSEVDSSFLVNERSALLPKDASMRKSRVVSKQIDLEGQSKHQESVSHQVSRTSRNCMHLITHPKKWDKKVVWQEIVVKPVGLLPAIFLGLLLNILDALSYGMILFPLGEPIFQDLGSDGIAMFYVSTIIAQLTYSLGGSIFKGGVGSEMIEVVPFFHSMAYTILNRVGAENTDAVLATTIISFSISCVTTGLVFAIMGTARLGALIGFTPRHLLIGLIGGVGYFLLATGVEVSARLPGNLEYNLDTLRQLFRLNTVFLWTVPLVLALVLLTIQRFVRSKYTVGAYFISITLIFFFFKFALGFDIQMLRDKGWVFAAPPAGNPWWHFYTLYKFKVVDWGAIVECIPVMLGTTFFGVLHVPINVPALGISTGEDNLNVDRELLAHGVSNVLSGCVGSIQNYLVYTNSLLFMEAGGTTRLAGTLLAVATFGLLLAGPTMIGYIPIMVVGALIFVLGLELLEEALVATWGKVHRLEYLTIVVIVITMGAWDFVSGILVGIVLACLNFVVQTSRKSAIRAEFTGEMVGSIVRRPPLQVNFLREAGKQILLLKLAGTLYFGTIVGIERRVRAVLDDSAFRKQPIRYLILDLSHISGIDFSAAEAFTRINRLLRKRDVKLMISSIDLEGEIGRSLANVGLFNEDSEVGVFQDLNSALEDSENGLLRALHRRQEHLQSQHSKQTGNLDVPQAEFHTGSLSETYYNSPRRTHLQETAGKVLPADEAKKPQWHSSKQPLPLILQAFEGISDKTEDFWFPATKYFARETFPQGTLVYEAGETAEGFYLIEEGVLRAEYDNPQGKFSELIVAGRPCGELPFFSETTRTATISAEKDSATWRLSSEEWKKLQQVSPDIARELLKVSLKLTKERMDSITSYVLTDCWMKKHLASRT